MDRNLNEISKEVYDVCSLEISEFELEPEGSEYAACRFNLSGRKIICRNAKKTPTKVGQFVTFWKRNGKGPIEPFTETDQLDFFVVNVKTENQFGQFVFPKPVLIKYGIISTDTKEGKRAFRVYPRWDIAANKQAKSTQKWQLRYFYEIGKMTDFKKVKDLYNEKALNTTATTKR